ncbi:MAG: hypothetical protein L0I76_21765, partial [Pseudonocardia sp.]|nr:hypothetical protein [Pseudonocardia sp.]
MTSPSGQPGPDDPLERDPAELGEAIRTGRVPVVPGSLVDLVMQSGISAPETPAPAPDAPEPDAVAPGDAPPVRQHPRSPGDASSVGNAPSAGATGFTGGTGSTEGTGSDDVWDPAVASGTDTTRAPDDPAGLTGPLSHSPGFASLVSAPQQRPSGSGEVPDSGQVGGHPVTADAPAPPADASHAGPADTPPDGPTAAQDVTGEQPDASVEGDDGPNPGIEGPERATPVTPLPRRRDPRTPDGLFPAVSEQYPDQDAGDASLDDDLGDLGDDPLGLGPLPSLDLPAEHGPSATPDTAAQDPAADGPTTLGTAGTTDEAVAGTAGTEPDEPADPVLPDEPPRTVPGPAVLPPISPAPTSFEPFPADSRQSNPPPMPPPEPDDEPDRSWPPRPAVPLPPEPSRGDDGVSGRADRARGGPATDVIPAAVDALSPARGTGSTAQNTGDTRGTAQNTGDTRGTAQGTGGTRGAAQSTGGTVQGTGGNRPTMPGRPRPGDVSAEAARLPAPPRPTMPGRAPRSGPDDRPDEQAPARPPMPPADGPQRGTRPGEATGDGLPPHVRGGLMLPPGNGGPRTAGHRRVSDSGPSTAVIPSPARPGAAPVRQEPGDRTDAPARGRSAA